MFSFHKPKVYRSSTGCCICKAKSSSSRFTDSKKYEEDFVECFQLEEKRTGVVCNACVLLVKRWKKLPEGSQRNWRHVVDARAGPGTKSSNKFKSKNKRKSKGKIVDDCNDDIEDDKKDIIDDIGGRSPSALSDDMNGGDSSDGSIPPSPTPSEEPSLPLPSAAIRPRTRATLKRLNPPPLHISNFIDMNFWKREKICCGIIYKGPNGEVAVDSRYFRPCNKSRNSSHSEEPAPAQEMADELPEPTAIVATRTTVDDGSVSGIAVQSEPIAAIAKGKAFSDTSSDSGYDESSNQGENGVALANGLATASSHLAAVNN